MAQLPEAVSKSMTDEKIYVVATCDRSNTPNAIYVKYLKQIDDGTLLIADNKMDKTYRNLQENAQISVLFLDDEKGAYQIKGEAEYLTSGPHFDHIQEWCKKHLARKGAVLVHVRDVYCGAEKL